MLPTLAVRDQLFPGVTGEGRVSVAERVTPSDSGTGVGSAERDTTMVGCF